MKKIAMLVLGMVFLSGLSGCTGWEQVIYGEVYSDESFLIRGDDRSLRVLPGKHQVSLSFENGVYGVSSPALVLGYQGRKYQIAVPRKSFDKHSQSIVATADDLEQEFSIRGGRQERELNSWTEDFNESCQYCGYCFDTWTEIVNGNPQIHHGYRYNCKCAGTQNVRYQMTKKVRDYRLYFHSKSQSRLAEFVGTSTSYVEKSNPRTLSDCR